MYTCCEDESLTEKLEESILEPQQVCAGVGDGGTMVIIVHLDCRVMFIHRNSNPLHKLD